MVSFEPSLYLFSLSNSITTLSPSIFGRSLMMSMPAFFWPSFSLINSASPLYSALRLLKVAEMVDVSNLRSLPSCGSMSVSLVPRSTKSHVRNSNWCSMPSESTQVASSDLPSKMNCALLVLVVIFWPYFWTKTFLPLSSLSPYAILLYFSASRFLISKSETLTGVWIAGVSTRQ